MTDFKFPRPVFEDESGCWFVISRKGDSREKVMKGKNRPRVNWQGERWSGHRLSFSLNFKEIPRRPEKQGRGLVLHKCDKDACVNPSHLYLGNQSQNMHDRAERNIESWQKVSQALKGRKHSEEHRKKVSEAKKGWRGPVGNRHSEETRKKMSESAKRRWEKQQKEEIGK